MEKRTPSVAYCRVSTQNQAEEGTIQIQKNALIEYCNGHTRLVKTFADDGVSGGLEDRLGLAEMFVYLESHPEIKIVLVWKLDRLARDLYLQEHLIKKMEALGVRLVSLKEPDLDSNDPMRKAFRQFMGVVSELEKAFIVMRLKEGRRLKAMSGKYAGGGVPYGYVSSDKELFCDKNQADVVREIFKMRTNGHLSMQQIAKVLNSRRIATSRNKKWYAGTIAYVLKNPRYHGIVKYGKEKAVRSDLVLVK